MNTVRIRARPYVVGPASTTFVSSSATVTPSAPSLTYTDGDAVEGAGVNASYNIGTAAADRVIMVALSEASNVSNPGSPTVVVNGVTLGTLLCETDPTDNTYASIRYGSVPSGSGSQNVTITYPGPSASNRTLFGIYAITGTYNSITGVIDVTTAVSSQYADFNHSSYAVVAVNIWAFTNDSFSQSPLIQDKYRLVAAGVETMEAAHVTAQSGAGHFSFAANGGGQNDAVAAFACITWTP